MSDEPATWTLNVVETVDLAVRATLAVVASNGGLAVKAPIV